MKNTMGITKFFALHIVGTLLFAWGYYSTFFRNIESLTYEETKETCFYIIFMFVCFGVLFTLDRNCNGLSVITNIILPFEVITMFLYFYELKYVIIACVLISAVVSIKYLIELIKLPIKTSDNKKRKKIKRRRIERWINYSRFATAVASLLIMVSLLVFVYIVPFIVVAFDGEKAIVPSEENKTEWTIENKYQQLSIFLDEEAWDKASMREKVKAMQTVCNIEAVHLGLNHELPLRINNVRKSAYAVYDSRKIRVEICVPYIQRAEEALSAVLHESRHAFQYELVRKYEALEPKEQSLEIYDEVRVFKEELDNYSEISSDSYTKMKVEQDSSQYSFERIEDYLKFKENPIK